MSVGLSHASIVADSSGALLSRQTYYAFGGVRTVEGSALPTDYGFTGQKWDANAGLMYYGARYYDPLLGRFTQADSIVPTPFDPQSLNRYTYVDNSPVNMVDPSGHTDAAPPGAPPCQEWDDWCWQNRYWTAQGQCYNPRIDAWNRPCTPHANDQGIVQEIYGAVFQGLWKIEEVNTLLQALYKVKDVLGASAYTIAFSGTIFVRELSDSNFLGRPADTYPWQFGLGGAIHLYSDAFKFGLESAVYTIIHEMGHAWDFRMNGQLSWGLANAVGSANPFTYNPENDTIPGSSTHPYAGAPGNIPLLEDWADSFAGYVDPGYFRFRGWNTPGWIRMGYVDSQIAAIAGLNVDVTPPPPVPRFHIEAPYSQPAKN